MRRGPCSNKRSRSTRTTPMRWRAKHCAYLVEYFYRWTSPETDYDTKILAQADRAIALAPDNVRAYWAKSRLPVPYRAALMRLSELRTPASPSIRILPRCMRARGIAESFSRPLRASEVRCAASDAAEPARSVNRGGRRYIWAMQNLAWGTSTRLLKNTTTATDSGYRPCLRYVDLAAAYALEGKMDEAKPALAEARRLNPKLTVKWLHSRLRRYPALFRRPAQGGAAGGMRGGGGGGRGGKPGRH